MKILTSYFYQIRNFKRNMIPLSTAVYDPKWFHDFKRNDYQFKDKNGVYNGIRAEPFVPQMSWGDCKGAKYCNYNPALCTFLREYYNQLKSLNFQNIFSRFEKLGAVQEREQFLDEPILVLMFHEPPNNPCSERVIVRKWFNENNYELKEF